MPKPKLIYFILFLLLAYFPLFYNLDDWSLRKWDESRNAVGALNMMETGDYLVRQYDNKLDTWETKPPMLLWTQIVSMHIFGQTVWAIRFPSALATLMLLLALIFFCGKTLQDWNAGFLSAFALLVSDGFIKDHVSRTGDHEALLVLFLMLSIFYFYKYLKDNQLRDILGTAIFTFFAVMTKSIIGLMFLPGLLFYLIFSKKLINILRGYPIYAALFLLLFGIGTYYFVADWTHSGYFQAVWKMELLPRFQNSDGKYIKPEAGHYIKLLVEKQRFPFWYLLPFVGFMAFKSPNSDIKKFVGIPLSIAVVFSFIMSFGVWFDWYDAPLYPLWALIFGCGLSAFFKRSQGSLLSKKLKYVTFFGSLFLGFLLFSNAYYKVSKRIYENFTYHKPNEQYGEFIEKRLKMTKNDHFSILYSSIDAYDAPMQFYQKTAKNREQEFNLIYVNLKTDSLSKSNFGFINRDSIAIGEQYLCCHRELTDSISKHFTIQVLEAQNDCTFFQIKSK